MTNAAPSTPPPISPQPPLAPPAEIEPPIPQTETLITEPFEQKLFFGEAQTDISEEEKTRRETLKSKWQSAFERITKGLAERGIFNPEIASELTNRLINEVYLSDDLYDGDPDSPVCCVDRDHTGKVIVAPAALEGIKNPDGAITECDTEYIIQHELGHLILHSGLVYSAIEVKSYLQRAGSIIEAAQRGEAVDTSNLPPEMAYIIESLSQATTNPNVLMGETRYVQRLIKMFSPETDADGKTKIDRMFDAYQKMHPEDTRTTIEKFKAHQMKQIAEELLNERLTSYLQSDGAEAGYWHQFVRKMTQEDPDAIRKHFEALGIDPQIIEQFEAIMDSKNFGEDERYAKINELIGQETTGKLSAYFESHCACFERFKALPKITKEQLAQFDEDDGLDFDEGYPYYEPDYLGNSNGGEAPAQPSGESMNDKIWRVVFGVK